MKCNSTNAELIDKNLFSALQHFLVDKSLFSALQLFLVDN